MKVSRRSFLTTTGVLTTGAAMGFAPFRIGRAQEQIRVGVIGTGSRGKGLIQVMNNLPGIQAVACCDVIPFRLEEGMAIAGKGAQGYSDYRKILGDKDIDAVVIATPFSMHADMALDAIDADKHIYCEKTMARGTDKILEMVKRSRNSKKIFQTGHQYHSSNLYKKAVQIIQSGYIGEISAFECQWNRNGDWRRRVPDPKWEKLINWRMYREYSGGLTAELSSHQIDFANWVLKDHPVKVTGFGGIDYWKDGRETYDNTHLNFEFRNGVNAKYTCLTTNGFEDYKIKVHGKKGTIVLDYNSATIYSEIDDDKKLGLVDGVSGATVEAWQKGQGAPIEADGDDPTRDALVDFKDAIVNNTEPISNIETGATTAFCVGMGIEAMTEGEIVYWNDAYNI